MKSSMARVALALLCLTPVLAVPQLRAKKNDPKTDDAAKDQKRAVHALNRLTFGPRPGDVQKVMAMGVDHWIDLQLHPEKISDDALQSHLAPLRTLRMSPKELRENFPDNQIIKQVMDGKRSMPSDPTRRVIYQVQIARLQQKFDNKQDQQSAPAPAPLQQQEPTANAGAKTAEELAAAAATSPDAMPPDIGDMAPPAKQAGGNNAEAQANQADDASMTPVREKLTPEEEAEAKRREDQLYADLHAQSLIDQSPDERYKKVMAMSTADQLELVNSFRRGGGQEFLAGMDLKQRETLMAMNNPPAVINEELNQGKLLRTIYSERQLEEVMTDFWFNHFNVFIGKGPERFLVNNYEQDVIRPHALGKFEDLLVSTAKSPAMLFYLDNWMSVGPNSGQAEGRPNVRYGPYGRPHVVRPRQQRRNSGLNENYGRELLELHTLSVNGGYSQRDVTEVAKVFTGWTIERNGDNASFRFDPAMHEPGPKFILGKKIKAKGEDEGKQVLHMLATSPQTAHFISYKLAQRFVSDNPPEALVDRMAKTFEKKKGDIREVLLTLFHSPEFWSDQTYRAKVKTPLEFVASAVRATGADVQDGMFLARQLNRMGMPLYGAQPPTGYSMKADAWVSSSELLTRMNFALALTSGKVRGVSVDAAHLAGDAAVDDVNATLSAMETKLLAADVSKQTHDSITAQLTESGKKPSSQNNSQGKLSDASTMAGLLLGSPEFQKR